MHPQADFARTLERHFAAGNPLIYLLSWDKAASLAEVGRVAELHNQRFASCSVYRGLRLGDQQLAPPAPQLSLLEAISRLPPRTMVWLDGFEIPVEFATFAPAVAAMAPTLRANGSVMVVDGFATSFPMTFPPVLARELIVMEVPLPGPGDLADLARAYVRDGRRWNDDDLRRLVRAAQGMTHSEARDLFAKTLQFPPRSDGRHPTWVGHCRQCSLAKHGLDEIDLGPDARIDGTGPAMPSSLLLTGDDGRGRDARPREIAATWSIPLLRLDTDKLIAPYTSWDVKLKRAIHAAETTGPAVLWIDKLESWIPASPLPDPRDARTAASMAATFIRWMRERTAPIIVVATAGRIDRALPDLLAPGVFSAMTSL